MNTAGNSASMPLTRGPMVFDSVTTIATSVATSAARNGMSYQRRVISGILACAEALHQRQADAECDDIEQDAAGERPVECAHQRGKHEPDRNAGRETDDEAAALREMHEDEAHQDGGGVHRQARERALRDEGRVVVEREEKVGRPGRNRQCRDQRADHRARALGDDRGRDHERRGDRHAQREEQKKRGRE